MCAGGFSHDIAEVRELLALRVVYRAWLADEVLSPSAAGSDSGVLERVPVPSVDELVTRCHGEEAEVRQALLEVPAEELLAMLAAVERSVDALRQLAR